jgi:hypothetical protein
MEYRMEDRMVDMKERRFLKGLIRTRTFRYFGHKLPYIAEILFCDRVTLSYNRDKCFDDGMHWWTSLGIYVNNYYDNMTFDIGFNLIVFTIGIQIHY